MSGPTRQDVAALVALGALARGLVWQDRPLWLDEAITVGAGLAADPFAAARATDLHPPLLAWLAGWVAAAAPDPAWARGLPLAASLLAIGVAARAGAAWDGRRGAVGLGLVAALGPPWVLYAQEVRPYALGLLAGCGLLGAAGTGSAVGLLGWGLLATLGGPYGTWAGVHAAAARVARRTGGRALAAWGALAVVQAALLVLVALPQRAAQGASLTTGHLREGFFSVSDVVPFTAQRTLEVAGYLGSGLGGAVAWGPGLAVVAAVARGIARSRDGLPAVALAPVAVMWVAAGLGLHPFLGTRHALALAPGLSLLAVRGAGRFGWAGLGLAAVGLLLQPRLPVEDVPGLLRSVGDRPIVVDASLAPAVALYGDGRERALPWREGPALTQALAEAPVAPGGCVLVARHREDAVRAALGPTSLEEHGAAGVRALCR